MKTALAYCLPAQPGRPRATLSPGIIGFVVLLFLSAPPLRAQVPNFIQHQSDLIGSNANFTGTGQFKFSIVSPASGNAFWKNGDNSASLATNGAPIAEPGGSVPLPVAGGAYALYLGASGTKPVPYAVFSHPGLNVRTWFSASGAAGTFVVQPDVPIPAAGSAMSIADGAVTSPKLANGIVTTAKLAPGAVTSAKIASNSITGDNLASSTLTATNLLTTTPPAAGKVLTFDGANLIWGTGTGSNTFSLNGTSAYYNGGNVGIGTSSPVHKLSIVGGPAWTSNSWTGSLELGNASAIAWDANSAGQRFGMGHTNGGFCLFRTASNPGTTASPAIYDFFIGDTGNVGVGTLAPAGKLDIVGAQDALRITGYQPVFTFRDSNANNARGAIQEAGGDMNIFTESYLSGANGYSFLKVANNGNVGIGSSQPVGKLEVVAQDALRLVGYQPFLTLFDSNVGYARGRIQSANGDLNFFTENYLNGSNTNAYAKLTNAGIFTVKALTIRGGADVAEPFEMKEEELPPGSVVVIDRDHPGRLKRSTTAYDKRVAGIISGANGVNPGIALHQEGLLDSGQNVALSGRVYVEADASGGPIEAGDLLTTSDTPGHAMKVGDHAKSQGAILGKAMSNLDRGQGMVLVLVTLQ